MFLSSENFNYKYAPVVSIKPAEMNALKQLPDKAKDILLPIIPLRGWGSSNGLSNSFEKVLNAFGQRKVIVDLESEFLERCVKEVMEPSCRDVFKEIQHLANPSHGYKSWCNFLEENQLYIPVVQIKKIDNLEAQFERLAQLNRGVVLRFSADDVVRHDYVEIIKRISKIQYSDIFIIYEFGQVTRAILESVPEIVNVINITRDYLGNVLFAISCSSFPFSFSGHSQADFSIIERLLYSKVTSEVRQGRFVYADWASARADSIGGGGRTPPPRIDYPLKNEWKIVREDFEDFRNIKKGEKQKIYARIAKKIVESDYWNSELHTWGTQLIELTSAGDSFGIDNPQKATAARINIHLHQQLYYDDPGALVDLDEEWID